MQAYALYSIASLRRELTETQDDATDKELSLKKEQQALSGKQDAEVYAATLAERNRIAREIHDNVGHLLSRAILLSGALKTVSSTDERLAEPLAQLDQSLNEAMDSIRESVHRLYNDSLDLEATAQSLIRDFTFCPVTLEYRCSAATPMEVRYCFLTVLKEALTNIAKHSNATKASVSMTEHPALFQMIVQDDGTQAAAESEKGEDVPRGIGLVGMSERAGALGGTVRFSSENGFRIFLTIPKKEEEGEV
ncbi:MAG: two-component sensor histidine kinase [Lachnospiraceae bacterium]|nr:two-component sensor histidine kinase [Lachnospiraceae bacterium]